MDGLEQVRQLYLESSAHLLHVHPHEIVRCVHDGLVYALLAELLPRGDGLDYVAA